MNNQLATKIETYRRRVEERIDAIVPTVSHRPAGLHEAMRYSLEAGGKRIRPVLLLFTTDLFNTVADPLPAAVALECLHTYTLIHDDLPALDDSPLRRGRPSSHARYNEATAVLAGDGLLTLAFEILAEHYSAEPELALRLIGELAARSGSRQLIGGQFEDIASEGLLAPEEALDYIHRQKTGALLTASLRMGAYFGNPAKKTIDTIDAFGTQIGLIFQIVDDLLDATASAETIGKPVGGDARAQKTTYVSRYGIDGAKDRARKHRDIAKGLLNELSEDTKTLAELVDYLIERAT